jgi:hypothetical protein
MCSGVVYYYASNHYWLIRIALQICICTPSITLNCRLYQIQLNIDLSHLPTLMHNSFIH